MRFTERPLAGTNVVWRSSWALCVLTLVLDTTGCSNQALKVPVATQGTPLVEVLGLHRWTARMIQDSLNRYSPGDSLHTDGCAAVLRYRLGFADASVTYVDMNGGGPNRVIVLAREPQDSNRVHFRTSPLDTISPSSQWRTATDLIGGSPRLFQAVVVELVLDSTRQATLRFRSATDSVKGLQAASFIRSRRSTEDLEAAILAVQRSPNVHDRSVAVLILSNFAGNPSALVALFDALRESDGPVKFLAARVLQALPGRSGGLVDWTPVSESVNAILNGTSVAVLTSVIGTLVRSGAGPEYAKPFLHDGGDMLLALLGSESPIIAKPAHTLLATLRGRDLGTDVGEWRKWIESL